MTSTKGFHIIQSPCCKTHLTTVAYASLNFSASEYWTDGGTVNSLAPTHEGLCCCPCGSFFHLSNAPRVGFLPRSKQIAPPGWEALKIPDYLLKKGQRNLDAVLETFDTRQAEIIEDEARAQPPRVEFATDDRLAEIISSKPIDPNVLCAARRRYWRHLNDPFRETYRKYKESHPEPDSIPVYRVTMVQAQNMNDLMSILMSLNEPNWVEIAELNRQLGNMDAAMNAMDRVLDGGAFGGLIRHLSLKGICAPVRYKL